MIVWPVKFMMMIWAFNANETLIDSRLLEEEYINMEHCEAFKPDNFITRDGVTIIFECVRRGGA